MRARISEAEKLGEHGLCVRSIESRGVGEACTITVRLTAPKRNRIGIVERVVRMKRKACFACPPSAKMRGEGGGEQGGRKLEMCHENIDSPRV